ncbi:MAG: hypothetical protein R3C18_03470 [Planctomycetaceae bacterium]
MSDAPQSANAPEPSRPGDSQPKSSEAKPRNPIERVLVWGGICLLLGIVLVEFLAKRGYDSTYAALTELSQDDTREVPFAEAQSAVALFPSMEKVAAEGESNVTEYRYSWFSIFKSGQYKISLRVADDGKPEAVLLGFVTAAAPEEESLVADGISPEDMESSDGGAPASDHSGGMSGGGGGGFGPPGGGGGGFGPGGGGQRPPNIVREAIDADGDGNFTAEEIEAAATALAKLDLDSDGALSAAELRGETGETAPPADAGGSPDGAEGEQPRRQFPNRIVVLIDKDEDGNLSAEELGNASAALLTLDADKDGAVTREEMRPPGFGRGGGGPGGPPGDSPEGSGRPQRPSADEAPTGDDATAKETNE